MTERQLRVLRRAAERFMRRRRAWRAATRDMRLFDDTVRHPSWRLVEEANDLLLRLR